VSGLWATSGISEKVWALPYLFSGICIRGKAARSCQIELVANNLPLAIGFLLLAEPETSSKEQVSNDNSPAASDQKPEARRKIRGENNGGK